MRAITLVLPFYENPGMLREQQRVWREYPDDIKRRLHVVVVDDCSPTAPALPAVEETGVASFRLYRTKVDVRWNWLFCRNLGVAVADTQWVLLTDIDHVVPAATLCALMTERLDPRSVHRFARVDAPAMTPYKPHPNSWFLTRSMFDDIGGYDERFSGFYGTDAEFRDRVHATARVVVMREDVLVRYPREVLADASTTTYGRKEEQDKTNVPRIREQRNKDPKWRPLRVTFPYERLL
ncbi:MAG: glycosyltransferase family A protein [Acidobacteriota bacterium]|nr:glycosyltransferase family A protein [Acidobacteriota bacterium]